MSDTIVISGTPRAGTTWLMEILELLPTYKSIFEPLQRDWFPEVKRLDLPGFPLSYTPVSEEKTKVKEYLGNVFTGNVVGSYFHETLTIRNLRNAHRRLLGKKLIVKFIRANMLLPWMTTNYQVRKIYFMIRHPCATVASQLKQGWIPSQELFKQQGIQAVSKIIDNEKLLCRIRSVRTVEEILAVLWSVDNFVPLSHHKPHPWYTVVYERLIMEGRSELGRIFRAINETVPKDAYSMLRVPSVTTEQSLINSREQLLKWKKILSKKQVGNILKVAEWFGLDFYDEDPEPHYAALKNWSPQF